MKQIHLLLAGAALLFVNSSWISHDIHISKGEVRYVAEEKRLQVMLHLWLDDLDDAMMLGGAPRTFIGSRKETDVATEYLVSYLNKHLEISVNGKAVQTTFLGREVTADALGTWVYLEAPLTVVPQRINVRYDALTELYSDQRNMIRLTGSENKYKVLLLSRETPALEVVFD